MASFGDFKYDYWAEIPMIQKVESPPCCWVISLQEGGKICSSRESLKIFKEWTDAQDFIRSMNLEGCKPDLLYWHEIIRKIGGGIREIILDMGHGMYISFPPKL